MDGGLVERRFRARRDLQFVQVTGVDIHLENLVLACKRRRLKTSQDRQSRDGRDNVVNPNGYSPFVGCR